MNFFTLLILISFIGVLALDTWIELLNLRNLRQGIPTEFRDLVDPEKYTKAQAYLRDTVRFDLVRRAISSALVLGFIFLGGFNRVDQWALSFGWGEIGTGLIFAAALSVLRGIVQLPFSIYGTFVIEEKYGFNKMTWKTFVGDLVKGTLVGVILGAPIFAGLIYFFDSTGELAWLYAWLAFSAVQIILLFLAPVLLMPLFNKFEPLPEGELKERIHAYLRKQNFQVSGIFTMDGSKRSTKANAFFTGFGRFRRLVLFDTLVTQHTVDELVAVFAHEVGHFKLGHIPKTVGLSLVSSGVMFFTFSLFIRNPALFEAFRMENVSTYASLIFIGVLYSPILRVLSVFTNLLSRKHEYEADEFAKKTYGRPEALIDALKKLSRENYSHLTPHPIKVFFDYSHPPTRERILALKRPLTG